MSLRKLTRDLSGTVFRFPVWAWLVIGLALRLDVAPYGVHPGDFATLTRWADAIYAHGLLNVYYATDANYPPLLLTILGISRWMYSLVAAGDASGPLWLILLKLPAILADLAIACMVHSFPSDSRGANALAFLFALFNPALIYLSAWWGQFESIYMLCALAAIRAPMQNRAFRAGMWLALGGLIKLQALVVLPILFVVLLSAQPRPSIPLNLIKSVLGFAIPLILALVPYAIAGWFPLVLNRLIALVASPGWLTVNALNFWYLATGSTGNWRFNTPLAMPDSIPVLAGLPASTYGLLLLGIWIVLVLTAWLIPRLRDADSHLGEPAWWAAALVYLGIFLFPTQAHERYSFGAVVMLLAAIALSRERNFASAIAAAVVSIMHFLNLIWAAPFTPALEDVFARNVPIGVAISAAFLLASIGLLNVLSSPIIGQSSTQKSGVDSFDPS